MQVVKTLKWLIENNHSSELHTLIDFHGDIGNMRLQVFINECNAQIAANNTEFAPDVADVANAVVLAREFTFTYR